MYSRGMGEGIPVLSPVLETAGGVVGSIAGAAAAPGALTLGALAVPIVGAAIAGVTLAVSLFVNRMGPKQKVYTTQIVNEAEPLLQRNLAAWQASNKTRSEQAQALANFDHVWGSVVASCDVRELGQPGQNCVNDRSRGGKVDWFSYYYDPIANDPGVVADPTVESMVEGLTAGLAEHKNLIPALLVGGLVFLAVSK